MNTQPKIPNVETKTPMDTAIAKLQQGGVVTLTEDEAMAVYRHILMSLQHDD